MRKLLRFHSLMVAGGLIVVAAACDRDPTDKASDRAAKRVNEELKDLKEEARDLTETGKHLEKHSEDVNAIDEVRRRTPMADNAPGAGKIADEADDVGDTAQDLGDAVAEFKYRRSARVATLRAVHAVHASQPMLINAFLDSLPLAERNRTEVGEKLTIFQLRLDEAANAIMSLEQVEAADWEPRNEATSSAIDRVNDSRRDAWQALHKAQAMMDRTSML